MMPDQSAYHLDIVIDHLTNSIRQVHTGESLSTDIVAATQEDIKVVTKMNKWHFPWNTEFRQHDRTVFKLVVSGQPDVLQGLVSLSDMSDHVYIHLAESAPVNFGPHKLYEGVGGNLFAWCCKRSWDNGNEGFVAFQSKTRLIVHYQETLGAIHIGNNKMIIYPEAALILINKYFKS